jgi:hypothetical protein
LLAEVQAFAVCHNYLSADMSNKELRDLKEKDDKIIQYINNCKCLHKKKLLELAMRKGKNKNKIMCAFSN